MQATIQNTSTSSSSAQPTLTHPKEGIMKKHRFSFIHRAVVLLALVALNTAPVSAQDCQWNFTRTPVFPEML